MRDLGQIELHNHAEWEVIPAPLVAARSQSTRRLLAGADWLLRRKRDGRFLAVYARDREGRWLRRNLLRGNEVSGLPATLSPAPQPSATAARRRLRALLDCFGIGPDYAERTGLEPVFEPTRLRLAARDRYQRPLWLDERAGRAWIALREAARSDDVALEAISGYRSWDYQAGIFERKLARGLDLQQILAVNAAPGFSEHHSGRAIDIGTPGEPPAEESFEGTHAFAWLQAHAGGFGFRLSYPRGNPHGVVYEPWHWCWHPCQRSSIASLSDSP